MQDMKPGSRRKDFESARIDEGALAPAALRALGRIKDFGWEMAEPPEGLIGRVHSITTRALLREDAALAHEQQAILAQSRVLAARLLEPVRRPPAFGERLREEIPEGRAVPQTLFHGERT